MARISRRRLASSSNRYWLCAAVLLGAPLFAAAAGAQQKCSVSGRVLDADGRPISFAAVKALRLALPGVVSASFGATANQRGEYCVSVQPGGNALPPGDYQIRASASSGARSASPHCQSCCQPAFGFASAEKRVTLAPGRTRRSNRHSSSPGARVLCGRRTAWLLPRGRRSGLAFTAPG